MAEEKKQGHGRLAWTLAGLALLVMISSVRFWEQLASTALPKAFCLKNVVQAKTLVNVCPTPLPVCIAVVNLYQL